MKIRHLSVFLCLAALLLPGCGTTTERAPDAGSRLLSTETTPSPGIARLSEDEIKAVGTLVYERKRGRFALVNAGPEAELTGKERVVAVVDDDSTSNTDLVALVGGYVELRGRAVEATEAVFPRVAIESIRIISLPADR